LRRASARALMRSRTPIAIGPALSGFIPRRPARWACGARASTRLRKTHLGHVAIATTFNSVQLASWLRGEVPAQTRTPPFKQLMKQAV
jgi:hypothetical protein